MEKNNAHNAHVGYLQNDHNALKEDKAVELADVEKLSRSSHEENPSPQEPLDPIEALGMPHWREVEKKLKRRLDLTLMPMLWILYFHNYLDRNNIAQARLSSFEEDLNLRPNDFNSAVSILTAGYMLGQIPSNMLLTRVRPGIYLSACAVVRSAVSASTAVVKTGPQLIAVRFLLGVTEAPLLPGAIYLISCWYPRREIALRVTALYTALCLAMACSGLIAAAIFANLDGKMGLAGWQWLFIIESVTGVFFALFICPFLIPDFPHSKSGPGMWVLTEEMQKVAVARMAADRVSEPKASNSVWYGLRLALTDIKTWVFFGMNISISAAFGFNNFYPSIVRGLGLGSTTMTILLTSPPYFMTAVTSMIVAWSSDRHKERGFHLLGPMGVVVIGYIISVATLHPHARYFASFLYIGGSFSANPLVNTWAVSTMGRTTEKRAAGLAVINVMGFFGNIMSPFFFPASDAPRYLMALLIMMGFAVSTTCFCMLLKYLIRKENKQLKEEAGRNGTIYNPFTT